MHAWYEIAIRGAEETVRAFVAGLVAGEPAPGEGVVFARDLGLAPESLGERVRELVHAGSHTVLLVPEPLAVAVADAVAERGGATGLAVERRRLVRAAHFTFEAEAFTTARAVELRAALFDTLPEGVTIADPVAQEERHPEVKGVELYAPLHAYTFRAGGRVRGPLPGVLEMRRRATTMDGVTVGALHLDTTLLP
jgi:hypothetical protein